jgi:hypothetical protein
MTSFVQRVLSLATAAATLSALSGEANAGQVGPEPINNPSLTFPGDTVSSSKRGPGCQGISKFLLRPPVFVAEAQPPAAAQTPPNPPQPDDAVTIIQRQNQRIIDAKRDLRETLRSRPPIPGS